MDTCKKFTTGYGLPSAPLYFPSNYPDVTPGGEMSALFPGGPGPDHRPPLKLGSWSVAGTRRTEGTSFAAEHAAAEVTQSAICNDRRGFARKPGKEGGEGELPPHPTPPPIYVLP
ncbi:unnamed protein product [Pleuronectes platessa]|uniref:Uncharacterized protein n=1 Tax=Pleuronectes platessa TaxID=8262 RepID=A0A9N7Y6M9_PLEPL|nr:unnamed protein product [Pleuronectes platessa]